MSNNVQPIENDEVFCTMDQLNKDWLQAYNTDPKAIRNSYRENAVLFFDRENYIKGNQAICQFYSKNRNQIEQVKSIHTTYRVRLSENPDMVYEIGYMITEKDARYDFIIIWSSEEGTWLRELEVITLYASNSSAQEGIDAVRRKWVALANEHSPERLSTEVYAEDFTYYNRNTIYQGYDKLCEAYSYMKEPDFQIDLKKEFSVVVQPDLVYEMGKWMNSDYSGSYIIIWKKQQNGEWKIAFDSNW